MFIDETIFPNAHAPQDAPAGTTARKGANETAPATLCECGHDAGTHQGIVPVSYCRATGCNCSGYTPRLSTYLRSMPLELYTPGEIAERRTMRYVEPPDHRITCWGGVATLEDAQD
jgi:hypothetical protein